MTLLITVWRELVALFVDDGRFAATILAWLAGGILCLRVLDVPPKTEAFLIGAGLVLILAENVTRSAGNRGGKR